MKNIELDGRVAVITGGARGIGRAACLTLAGAGASVVIADLDLDRAEETAALVGDRPVLAVQADISKEDSVKRLYDAVIGHFGRVDILVNSAGICKTTPILEIEAAEWDRVMDVNLRGTFLMGREAFRLMKERRAGKIVNVASVAGKIGAATAGSHYAASKAGVISLTKTLAFQAAPYKINVNAVCPGPIETEMTGLWDKEVSRTYADRIPWKEFGQPRDVAEAVAFLVSDRARYITGEILDINGGLLMD